MSLGYWLSALKLFLQALNLPPAVVGFKSFIQEGKHKPSCWLGLQSCGHSFFGKLGERLPAGGE